MNIYDSVLSFHGTWRTYQQRVLNLTENYMKDDKIHIVAAPGSGKTTLGIELIRRLGNPCLILSPSITIRQQWIARIQESFLQTGCRPEDWISNDIRRMKPITAITYQALHSCMKQYVGILKDSSEETGEPAEESVDYSEFHIYEEMKKSGIRTICLDEAHHLRSEWWKALEEFLKNIPDVKIIALTATPPYDSTPAQWKRYIDLCGPIDEEIFTPELVKEGSLCPHQDYVYFNTPAEEEKAAVREYIRQTQKIVRELTRDEQFIRVISSHRGIQNPMEYSEKFLEHPKYFSSLLIFLNAVGIPFSPYLKELTGGDGKLPNLTGEWMEALLQGFLYEDTEGYPDSEMYREQLLSYLKASGCIYRNKVRFVKNEKISKLLMASKGKLNSIIEIVRNEQESLGNDLRLLILCDYIKKEMLPLVGTEEKTVGEIGALPIFETLRRQQIRGIRLGVLSGSVVIIPSDAETELSVLLGKYQCEASISELNGSGYSKVTVKGGENHIVRIITDLFTQGYINTLIGTKSLLGEGWDSPCINTLILATYVGSFMLSNQMRGRAIRTFQDCPDKTGNIWHLACVFPSRDEKNMEEILSDDYETLVRRFQGFLGVSFQGDYIESGIGRLGLEQKPESEKEVNAVNRRMISQAKNRDALRKTWEKSLQIIYNKMSVEELQEVRKDMEPGFFFLNAVGMEILLILTTVLCLIAEFGLRSISVPGFILSIVALLSVCGIVKYGYRIVNLCTPQKRIKKVADCMLQALIQTGQIEEPAHCRIEIENGDIAAAIWLKGGTTRDKTLLAVSLAEFWGAIDNPRYLLIRKNGIRKRTDCYAVPEVFGKRKESVGIFCKCMCKWLGAYDAVYTRTPEGRRCLLKARTYSFVNKNDRVLNGKKQVKNEYT